jgi:hypothetical protein
MHLDLSTLKLIHFLTLIPGLILILLNIPNRSFKLVKERFRVLPVLFSLSSRDPMGAEIKGLGSLRPGGCGGCLGFGGS